MGAGSPRRRGRGSKAESKVARLYQRAGFQVHRNRRSRAGEIDIIAKRAGTKLIVEVRVCLPLFTSTDIMKLYRKAKYHGGIPVLRIGPHVKLTENARSLARELGVRIKRY